MFKLIFSSAIVLMKSTIMTWITPVTISVHLFIVLRYAGDILKCDIQACKQFYAQHLGIGRSTKNWSIFYTCNIGLDSPFFLKQ